MKRSWSSLVALGFVLAMSSTGSVAEEGPRRHLYDLGIQLETQRAATIKLGSFAGYPLIISMFYSSCTYACPLIINNIKSLERQLSEGERSRVRVLLVSFDPDTDSPARLGDTARKYDIDQQRWTLARASASDVEDLAAVLGVKFKRIDAQNIGHNSVIHVIAADGLMLQQTESYNKEKELLKAALKRALN